MKNIYKTMSKSDIEEILLINWYLVRTEMETPRCESIKKTRKYLDQKIKDMMERNQSNPL